MAGAVLWSCDGTAALTPLRVNANTLYQLARGTAGHHVGHANRKDKTKFTEARIGWSAELVSRVGNQSRRFTDEVGVRTPTFQTATAVPELTVLL
jgi:hypothetical protein